ncbi:hypothetical protein BDK51DRAFT_30361 [Blyttiomyces helicus]|uniref:F-box domain-containing protein n=1 Tax=Blyttiomyces helicus TaxID=388810 RepID=A0A4P9W770_9FUNG|nr:hypothetical protein BDK51DRAFT_30361 [Blyttiomyces helicus]|eukprot:RKO88301.1 hypothetical protein BDK51DRAFT_30361 [Blyttiomyces helicus]
MKKEYIVTKVGRDRERDALRIAVLPLTSCSHFLVIGGNGFVRRGTLCLSSLDAAWWHSGRGSDLPLFLKRRDRVGWALQQPIINIKAQAGSGYLRRVAGISRNTKEGKERLAAEIEMWVLGSARAEGKRSTKIGLARSLTHQGKKVESRAQAQAGQPRTGVLSQRRLSHSFPSALLHGQSLRRLPLGLRNMYPVFDDLPVEMCLKCFAFLPLPDFARVLRLSKKWNKTLDKDFVWRERIMSGPSVAPILRPPAVQAGVNFAECIVEPTACLKQLMALSLAAEQNPLSVIGAGVRASSENNEGQSIKYLEDRYRHFQRYWSSKGSDDPLSDEYLIFQLHGIATIVTEISVTPYEEGSELGVSFSLGFSPDNMHYQSPDFKMENISALLPEPQMFKIKPTLAIGGFLRLDLKGRTARQPSNLKFYTALRLVRAKGFPLGFLEHGALATTLVAFSDRLGYSALRVNQFNYVLPTNGGAPTIAWNALCSALKYPLHHASFFTIERPMDPS